ncbi:MAG: peptide chain release factor-like protein [Planctomycetota bacterium]|nr:MAG: peptide chain release factor-like protein [Planctomycetota bacterium]
MNDAQLLRDCEVDCYRASGPGGQKRNKTSSAVRLRHRPTGLIAQAEEDRSQHVNKRRALRRLREKIALHVREPVAPDTFEPDETLRSCLTKEGRIRVALRNERYPLIVCRVLDLLEACEGKVSDVARRLGVPTAELVRFLARDPKLREQANRMRARYGLRPLRSPA